MNAADVGGSSAMDLLGSGLRVDVCGPRDTPQPGTLKLSVSSAAPIFNPPGWKHLWKLSPFAPIDGGIAVPGLAGVRSITVENAWQMLKVWPGEGGWRETDALAAFSSSVAVRYPRGRGAQAEGFHWGETGEVINRLEARRRIYTVAYQEMLGRPEQAEIVEAIRKAAEGQPVWLWDFDSWAPASCGLNDIADTIDYPSKSFAHSFVLAMHLQGRYA